MAPKTKSPPMTRHPPNEERRVWSEEDSRNALFHQREPMMPGLSTPASQTKGLSKSSALSCEGSLEASDELGREDAVHPHRIPKEWVGAHAVIVEIVEPVH